MNVSLSGVAMVMMALPGEWPVTVRPLTEATEGSEELMRRSLTDMPSGRPTMEIDYVSPGLTAMA